MNPSTASIATISARGSLQNVVSLEPLIEQRDPTEETAGSVQYRHSRAWSIEVFYGGEFKISGANTQVALDEAVAFLTDTLSCTVEDIELLRVSVRGQLAGIPPNSRLTELVRPIEEDDRVGNMFVGEEASQYGGDVYFQMGGMTVRLFIQAEMYVVSGVRVSDTAQVAPKVREVKETLESVLTM